MEVIWRPISELKEIKHGISGHSYKPADHKMKAGAYSCRANAKSELGECTSYCINEPLCIRDSNGIIEYTDHFVKIQGTFINGAVYHIDDSLLNTKAGKITLSDEGEFGGYLAVGNKTFKYGNFRTIFKFKDRRFTVDSLNHMLMNTFRLIEINDDGTITEIYDANKLDNGLEPTFENRYNFGYSIIKVEQDHLYVICSGHRRVNKELIYESYLVDYDGTSITKTSLNLEDVSIINSLIFKDSMMYLGCDKEVVQYNLKDNTYKIFTNKSDEVIAELLQEEQ